jgi:hypothetical protein
MMKLLLLKLQILRMKRQATIQNGILNKYRSLFGADSKEETGLCYMIYSDNLYSIDHKKLQTRATRNGLVY